MKKIKLQLDGLCVESFETSRAAKVATGTVRAHDSVTEWGEPTCDMSCEGCITYFNETCRYVCP